jgi:hypothetical protein
MAIWAKTYSTDLRYYEFNWQQALYKQVWSTQLGYGAVQMVFGRDSSAPGSGVPITVPGNAAYLLSAG